MLIAKKIKLEVSDRDAATLEFMQGKCRGLYNWWVMKLKNGEKWPGTMAAKKTLKESRKHDESLNGVYNKLLQKVYFRLGAAMDAFFKRCQAGEKPGFPRVRPRHSFFTLCYPGSYLTIENTVLILPTGGKGKHKHYPDVRAKLTEEPPAEFGEVAITRDGRGNYSASFSHQKQEQAYAQGEVVAFDLGIKTLAVGTNEQGRVYHIGGFKGSRWYNKQLDKIRNRAVYNDWGLYTFIQMLTYKCLLYGKELIILDEYNTSKMCSGCEHLQDMPLWKQTYTCPKCGLVMDRDENSAVNILTRYFARRGPYAPDVECGVLQDSSLEVASTGLAQDAEVQQLELW